MKQAVCALRHRRGRLAANRFVVEGTKCPACAGTEPQLHRDSPTGTKCIAELLASGWNVERLFLSKPVCATARICRDCTPPARICAETGFAPLASAGDGTLPNPHRDASRACARICLGTRQVSELDDDDAASLTRLADAKRVPVCHVSDADMRRMSRWGRVPARMWVGRLPCRNERDEPGPGADVGSAGASAGADVAAVSPDPLQMLRG
jgi:hypothetical protein